MIRRPPRSTRTDTLFPYTPLFRSFGVVKSGLFPAQDTGLIWGRASSSATVSFAESKQRLERLTAMLMADPDVATVGSRLGSSRQRSEEHTSELQSLMRISYAVFCLKKKHNNKTT